MQVDSTLETEFGDRRITGWVVSESNRSHSRVLVNARDGIHVLGTVTGSEFRRTVGPTLWLRYPVGAGQVWTSRDHRAAAFGQEADLTIEAISNDRPCGAPADSSTCVHYQFEVDHGDDVAENTVHQLLILPGTGVLEHSVLSMAGDTLYSAELHQ